MPYLGRRFRPILSLAAAGFRASGGALAAASQPAGTAVARSHPQQHERPLSGAVNDTLAASQAAVHFGGGHRR